MTSKNCCRTFTALAFTVMLSLCACEKSHSAVAMGKGAASNKSAADAGAADARAADAGAADAAPADGGLSAFISFNLAPDVDCTFSTSGGKFFPTGQYDVSDEAGACHRPYVGHFLVVAAAKKGTVVLIHSAEVTLETKDGQPIVFDGAQKNPFLVATGVALESESNGMATGIVAVEVVPEALREQMQQFAGSSILASVRVLGTTSDDEVDIVGKPFLYTIDICNGCLISCGASAPARDDECHDSAGADGRMCIDPRC